MRVVRNRVYKIERVFPLLAHHYPRGGLVGFEVGLKGDICKSKYLEDTLYAVSTDFFGKIEIGF